MRIYILFLLMFTGLSASITQTNSISMTPAIKGIVIDKDSGEPMTGVTVLIKGSLLGTSTDESGFFEFKEVEEGTYTLRFSFIGYASFEQYDVLVEKNQNQNLGSVAIEKDAFSLSAVTVTPGKFEIMGDQPLSKQTLGAKDLKNMSWAEDITRAVSRLPGISSSDFSSKFAIRGGEADEVLISLDGMELYEPFHQRDFSGGLFSIVDIETIRGIDLMTGGFSADYGNRLSGALNLKTKNIKDDEKETSVGLSIMNARLYTSGKYAKNKGSYLFSARRGMLDLLFKAVGFTENLPEFYDVMGKTDFHLSKKHILSLHLLHAGDKTAVRDISEDGNFDKNDTRYGNNYAWLTLNSYFNPRVSSRLIAYSGLIKQDRLGSFNKYELSDKGTFELRDQRSYQLIGLKHDWDWQLSEKVAIKSGYEAKHIKADYDYFMELHEIRVDANEVLYDYDKVHDIHLNPSGEQIAVYLSTKFRILPRLILETGLRNDYTSYTEDNVWSPRVSAVYSFSKNTFLRAAWGHYYQSQFINNLDVNNGNVTFNPAELAEHYVLGVEHLFDNGINLRVEAYHKALSNISPQWQNMRDHLEMFPEQRNDNARIIYNGAISKGIEVFLKKDNGGKFSWWLSYALAKAEDDVKDIEFDGLLTERTGKTPRLNDQRHTIYFDLNYRPNNKWHFNLSWTYYKGWPRTDYTYDYQVLPNGDFHFYQIHKEFNATLYPAYHRMDLRANRQIKMANGKITTFLHIVNVYNQENLRKFDLDVSNDLEEPSIDEQGNYLPVRDDVYWLGILPVFGASWEF